MTTPREPGSLASWRRENAAHLTAHLARLALLLRRRVLWLRHLWQVDPAHAFRAHLVSDLQADWLLGGATADETQFYDADIQAGAIAESLGQAEERLRASAQRTTEAGRPPALDTLAELFGLTAFEKDLLVLAAAPALDARFERAYAYVQDEMAHGHATLDLALTLFARATDPILARDSLLASRPLRRFQLLVVGDGRDSGSPLLRPLFLDERMCDFLRGANHCDERVRPLVRPVLATPLTRVQEEQVPVVMEAVGVEADRWPVVNLLGAVDAGAAGVAQAACERLGARLFAIELERLLVLPASQRMETYALLEREAALANLGYLVDGNAASESDALRTVAREIVDRLEARVIVVSHERWHTDCATSLVPVPKADRRSQRELWQAALASVPHSLNGTVDQVAEQFDLQTGSILRAAAGARARALRRPSAGEPRVTPEDLWDACREQSGLALDDLARRVEPCFSWADIVLPRDTLAQLRELADQVRQRSQVYEAWGFGAQLGRGRGIGALFSGTSGTGKTMAAEVLARELRLDLYRVDLSGVVSKYIGETEKNLRRIFDAGSGAILFFDEADALFGTRTEVRDSHDRYANIEVNYLLQRMEDYAGVAILATNRRASLDTAFLRRLRFVVDFPFPDAVGRRTIWRQVFPPGAALDQLDYDTLARWEIPGGNIRSIAVNAAFLAASEDARIGMTHVVRAAAREYRKIEKPISAAEFGAYLGLVRT